MSRRWSVEVVDEIGSTNDELIERLGDGRARDGDVLVARHQVTGRGRLDRRWDSPPGRNLLMSIVIDRPAVDPARATRAVGVASLLAAQDLFVGATDRASVELKWPNDLLRDGRKLSGVLAQLTAHGQVVAGVGLNVTWAPPDAAALAPHVDDVEEVDALVAAIRDRLLGELARLLDADDPAATIDDEYRRHLGTLGHRVRVELADGSTLVGEAIDVDDGRLVVSVDVGGRRTERRIVDVGDVIHLRPDGR